MATIVGLSGQAKDVDRESWSHQADMADLPTLERTILDLVDRLGYSPAEAAAVLELPRSRVEGGYWRSRWLLARRANRVSHLLRDAAQFDPRHAAAFELSIVCGYSFVEIAASLGYDRGHACRVVQDTGAKLRELCGDELLDAPDETAYQAAIAAPADDAATARECRWHFAHNATLAPLERAELWREMLAAGDFRDQTALAEAFELPASTVRNQLRLLQLPRSWIARVARGALPFSHLRCLIDCRERDDILTAAAEHLDALAPHVPTHREWSALLSRLLKRPADDAA